MSSAGSGAAGSGGGTTGDGAAGGGVGDPAQLTRTATPDSDASAVAPSSIAVHPDSRRVSIRTGDLRAYLRTRELQHRELQLQHKELLEAVERLHARMDEDREALRVERERAARCCAIV